MSTSNITTQKVNFKVFRFNADEDYLPYYEDYNMDVTSEEVVLDILNRIKWDHDGSFSYRRSCRHGICGACAIKVNGRSTLACKENMSTMIELFGSELTIEPLSIKRAVKDMIIDKGDFWEKHDAIHPYLISDVDEHPEHEHIVTPEEADRLLEADLCIQCGACHYACPALEVNDRFLGPAAFAKAYRFEADVRDQARNERLQELHSEEQGIWDCVKCFECAEVCPKDVNPIDKITKLHLMLFKEGVATSNVATRHAVGFKHSIAKHGMLDEGGLVLYSEGPGIVKHIPVALQMFRKGKIVMPWNMPKSDNLDEIQKLIKSSSTAKF
ncbi:succinate dehydrogenase/fumarate reductase, iron-sulfur protein [Sulfurimonas gotlandica GD1]|jgi:succinate dehydrogenase / fumarate reductase iron-sulfur subunit|uniref:Fumarate reductase iron-sulfur subunit n=1 Tax=Sulfurimonas gotlandica (strain DSM 19862 / JCM 16533 / GD1) TaxID=929558 RepID=B6BJQ5_SULGG|nr:succinate dehydrogenase iron-sulfur subunit [Sulfurimonas gotlandica]EDZ62605.1 succinate dehydrogenase/fumarate reductase iron-sulfur protein [Sulfurimonas gotlandica GD1]EHP31302.1 succinate dehydrogenase/fumarate reductase, iron-sulfur protein [Sulfurimonas gotlandica GD1]